MFLFFIGIFFIAKNEHITNIEEYTKRPQLITLYNVKIVNWRTYSEMNFIAKAQKIYNPKLTNYLYAKNVEIQKLLNGSISRSNKNSIYIYAPYLEIYTNLFEGRSKNLKTIVKSENYSLTIYSQEMKIKNKRIELLKNYIYHQSKDLVIKIYYPQIDIKTE